MTGPLRVRPSRKPAPAQAGGRGRPPAASGAGPCFEMQRSQACADCVDLSALQRGPSAWMATCDTRAAMLLNMRPEQRLTLFATSGPLRHPRPSPSPSLGASRRTLSLSTPVEGVGSATGASDACEAPGFACHDRHAGASLRRLAFPATGTLASRRSTVAIFGPGPCAPLSGIPSGIVRRPCSRHGSSLPEGAGLAGLPRRGSKPRRGRHASLRLSGSPLEAPLDERG